MSSRAQFTLARKPNPRGKRAGLPGARLVDSGFAAALDGARETMVESTEMSTGYSGTPLAKKLGFKPGQRVSAPGAPPNYRKLLAPLPAGIEFQARISKTTDLVHLFTASKAELEKSLTAWLKVLGPEAAIWVSWPKKTSKVPTDITEDTIRAVALPMGLVDIKVCAVDETWSGLKLVLRKELRPR